MNDFFRGWSLGQNRPWLRQDGKNRLFTLKLMNVENPLEADALWDASTGGDKGMFDSLSNQTSNRLSQALNAHRYTTTAYDEGRPIPRTYVFTDIVIWVSANYWNGAVSENSERLFLMSERLLFRHQQTFADNECFQGREPHFSIMPLPELSDSEVICQFGSGVFLPTADDIQTAQLSITRQGYEPDTLPDWHFFERRRDDKGNLIEPLQVELVTRPSGLYAEQRLLLVGNRLQNSALLSPLWLDHTQQGEMIINLNSTHPMSYGDNISLQATPPKRIGDQTYCHFHEPDNPDNTLSLVIERVPDQAQAAINLLKRARKSAHTGTIIDNGEALSGFTHIDFDEGGQPDYAYALQLTGIVLPRLDIFKASLGLHAWELYLDKDGLPIQHEDACCLTLQGRYNDATNLYYKIGSEDKDDEQKDEQNEWLTLDSTQPLPYPEHQAVYIEPPLLQDKHLAILPITLPVFTIPLRPQATRIGRYIGEKSPADIPLGWLQKASQLFYQRGGAKGNLETMGLSGEHIEVELKGRRLQVRQTSKNLSHIIQTQGSIRQTLNLKTPVGEIRHGESIVIGTYRFQLVETFLPEQQE